ncbi:hypothetical protein QWJ34_11965 [Saccharibacillus sp. CPCC 101409]|uniref:hypothetical protein n=1 Tax=Saccharibacillus sp. CPCC 101409 TaxID=3058041 RepID=UPI002671A44A|nr:hypothetical protein [Saccharibacillus sp. CPCC 101409]MDO3410478.1 hypothetical protein [Saccharibacillus sp. CPCC 101409]
MKYKEEFRALWDALVPDSGQADTVQGELVRSIQRLRSESHRNGNANWDEGFELYCDFIEVTFLPPKTVVDGHFLERVEIIINRLRQPHIPYMEDAYFDELSDYAVEWCRRHPEPIPKPHDPRQYR